MQENQPVSEPSEKAARYAFHYLEFLAYQALGDDEMEENASVKLDSLWYDSDFSGSPEMKYITKLIKVIRGQGSETL